MTVPIIITPLNITIVIIIIVVIVTIINIVIIIESGVPPAS